MTHDRFLVTLSRPGLTRASCFKEGIMEKGMGKDAGKGAPKSPDKATEARIIAEKEAAAGGGKGADTSKVGKK
ncbi:MAG TPA: hypothetical protein PLG62_12275 [Pararhodobacter sp.]|nr:hypothetical protein [Pararhodobacter sp.]